MSVEGRLGAGGGADLLFSLWDQERTGILDLQVGELDRKLVLVDGEVRYVASGDAEEKLPVRLVSKGLVTRQALVEASKGNDLRKALAAAGALSEEAHDRALLGLVADVVTKVFPATDGTFQFVDKAELQLPGLLSSHDMVPTFWAAARQCSAAFATTFLGDPAQRLTRAPDDAVVEHLSDLSPQEGYVLSRIDGYCSVNDVLSVSPLGADETRRFIFGLCCIGLVDAVARPRLRLPKPTGKAGKRRVKISAPRPAQAASSVTVGGTIPMSEEAQAARAAPSGEGLTSSWLAGSLEPGSLEAVRDMHVRTASANHYAVLGVAAAADVDEIRHAYYSLARLYHPDRFGRETSPHDRDMVEDLFSRIGSAFDVLSDPVTRREYDHKLESGAIAAEQEQREKKVDRKDIARGSHEKGKFLLSIGDRVKGLQFLEHAVEADGDTYEYRMTLAHVLVGDSRTRKRAERHLLEAIRIDPSKAEAYYLLGTVYKAANLKSRAIELFHKGLSWDATHEGIHKELADMDDAGGRLGGLFGKKK